jgi:hypothetical protein
MHTAQSRCNQARTLNLAPPFLYATTTCQVDEAYPHASYIVQLSLEIHPVAAWRKITPIQLNTQADLIWGLWKDDAAMQRSAG